MKPYLTPAALLILAAVYWAANERAVTASYCTAILQALPENAIFAVSRGLGKDVGSMALTLAAVQEDYGCDWWAQEPIAYRSASAQIEERIRKAMDE